MKLTTEIIDDLLENLDNAACDYDGYEYGLPLCDDQLVKLRNIVRVWFQAKVESCQL